MGKALVQTRFSMPFYPLELSRASGAIVARPSREEVMMRILSPLACSLLLALAATSAGISPGSAADRTPNAKCRWDGTAPFCDGACSSGEVFSGAASNDERAAQFTGQMAGQRFGESCATGTKAWCCILTCPKGFRLEKLEPGGGNDRKSICREIGKSGGELTKQTGPETKRKKGPIEAPSPVDETELNKGPIVAPGPVEGTKVEKGPITAPSEPPATKRTAPITE